MTWQGKRIGVLLGICLGAVLVVVFLPPIPQDPRYHRFADAGALLGIPNFWNVVSNIPFLIVGIMGLFAAKRGRGGLPALRTAYALFFIGVFLTGLGSAYYHWRPDNETLFWDRLPMTLSLMSFLSIIVGEHMDIRAGNLLLWPLIALGVFSVWYWRETELMGQGDLRLYGIVQFLPLLLTPLTLILLPSRFSSTRYLWLMLLAYGLSKLLEFCDLGILRLTGMIGGHPLKHLAAASAAYCFYVGLLRRKLRTDSG